MNRLFSRFACLLTLTIPMAAATNAEAADADPAGVRFFEEKVHPILEERCWDCHGEDVQESGLRLDSRRSLLAGGDSGKKIAEPGKPETSLLIQAVRRDGKITMPPDDPLPEEEIAALVQWVTLGLPWSKSKTKADAPLTKEERYAVQRSEHWAFQPIKAPPLPAVKHVRWIANPVDRFILAGLEAAQLAPSPEADRYTLIRRLSFDLIGLPPAYDEVQAFVHDQSADAYEHLVNRLLASPRYGERWGRHWLDVARYADTRGYAFGRERRYPYAYTYRDYVISAFNQDMPFDRFILEQLAGDLLSTTPHDSKLAAMGFLTVGRKFNNRQQDIDDQIDVVGRGLLGLTVACARCHDHKYDPIPTADYYSLYGVFASSTEPADLPVIGDPNQTPGYEKFKQELDRRKAELEKFKAKERDELVDTARQRATDYLVRAITRQPEELLEKMPFISLRGEELKPRLVQRWRQYLVREAKADHPVWGPLFQFAPLAEDKFPEQAPAILAAWREKPAGLEPGQLNADIKRALEERPPKTKIDLARIYGDAFAAAYAQWLQADHGKQAESKLPAATRQLLDIAVGPGSPTDISADDITSYLSRAENNKYRELQRKIEAFQVDSPGAPPRAMVLRESPKPVDPRIFIRGNAARPGKPVPRQFLLAIAGPERKPFHQASGRLELAQKIVAADNPLTARVIVNRVWMHHFGQPLVRTPSDFGTRCERPVQMKLLDYLASQFMTDGWSLKQLHRQIVLSRTYRQASLRRDDCQRADPENMLYWKMNRQRLEFEPMRDALLFVAGELDTTMGGRPANLTNPPYSHRRAVYGYIDRQDLPGLFRVFDLASPDQSCPRRSRTTVPQQALFMMNSPFVIERAEAVAKLPAVAEAKDLKQRVEALYMQVFARLPDNEEIDIARRFAADLEKEPDGEAKLDVWQQYAQLLMMSNQFLFVD